MGNAAGTYIQINNFAQNAQVLTFTLPSTQPYTALTYAFRITSAKSPQIQSVPMKLKMFISYPESRLKAALKVDKISGISKMEIMLLSAMSILAVEQQASKLGLPVTVPVAILMELYIVELIEK